MSQFIDKTYLNEFWEHRVKKAPEKVNYETAFKDETNNSSIENDPTIINAINEYSHVAPNVYNSEGEKITKELGGVEVGKKAFKVTKTVGGIKADDIIDNMKISDLLEKMLNPYEPSSSASFTLNRTFADGVTTLKGPGLPNSLAKVTFTAGNISLTNHDLTGVTMSGQINGDPVIFDAPSGKDKYTLENENKTMKGLVNTSKTGLQSNLVYTYYWDYTTPASFTGTMNYGPFNDVNMPDNSYINKYPAGSDSDTKSVTTLSYTDPNWLLFTDAKLPNEYTDEELATKIRDLYNSVKNSGNDTCYSYSPGVKSTAEKIELKRPAVNANTSFPIWVVIPKQVDGTENTATNGYKPILIKDAQGTPFDATRLKTYVDTYHKEVELSYSTTLTHDDITYSKQEGSDIVTGVLKNSTTKNVYFPTTQPQLTKSWSFDIYVAYLIKTDSNIQITLTIG